MGGENGRRERTRRKRERGRGERESEGEREREREREECAPAVEDLQAGQAGERACEALRVGRAEAVVCDVQRPQLQVCVCVRACTWV